MVPAQSVDLAPDEAAAAAAVRDQLLRERPTPVAGGRLMSIDALRGFDMFWIIGAASLGRALQHVRDNEFTQFLASQLKHADWIGFNFYDLIFPLFLFLIGVSIPFSLEKTFAQFGYAAAIPRILRRSVLLFVLGVFYSGGLSSPWPDVQLAGVLQRIAACYLAAALLYCYLRPISIAVVSVLLLVGYWALLVYVPFPDLHLDKETVTELATKIGSDSPAALAAATPGRVSGVYEEGYNLTNFIDFRFLPGKKSNIYYINEGLLSTLSSISLCLFGILAGLVLKGYHLLPWHKVMWLVGVGVAAVLLGWVWGFQFPIIKRIWSSSFVLMASGYSAILLGVFYTLVDIWQLRSWCQPFVWIGMNSITIYLAANIVSFPKIAERLVGGDVKAFLNERVAAGVGELAVALVGLSLALMLVGFLYRRRIFLRL